MPGLSPPTVTVPVEPSYSSARQARARMDCVVPLEGSERELKFSVPADFVMPDLNGVTGWVADSAVEQHYETQYYDTADYRISRWNCGLRYRDGEGWTVKAPSATTELGVIRRERTYSGAPLSPPAEALHLLRAYIRRGGVQPVAKLAATRRKVIVRTLDGVPAAEVVDDLVHVEGEQPSQFQEVELEWKEAATEEGMHIITGRLVEAGATVTIDAPSKQQRALGDKAKLPPEVEPPDQIIVSNIGDVVRQAINRAVTGLLAHDPGIRFGGDPEDVHQARVATRRLRSDLGTFRDLVETEWVAHLRSELAWLGGELGAVRDLEVLEQRLRGHLLLLDKGDVPAAEELLATFNDELASARQSLLAALDSDRYLDLLDTLIGATRSPNLLPEAGKKPRKIALKLVRKPWRQLKAAQAALGDSPEDAALHQLRILAKRARYAAEAVTSVLGEQAAVYAKAVANVQTVLGEHQDSFSSYHWLRDHGTGAHGFSAGQMAMLEVSLMRSSRAVWPDAWDALDRKRIVGWLEPATVPSDPAQLKDFPANGAAHPARHKKKRMVKGKRSRHHKHR